MTAASSGWSALVLAGYFFGRIPIVQENFETVILGIIAVSLMPIVVEWLRARRGRRARPASSASSCLDPGGARLDTARMTDRSA